MEFKPKNREWVKNAAIIFLAVLLVLTFFSNTIMNRTLPEVATQYVTSGTVTARVRGTGTVVANGSHQVKADATREIRSVMVREGQEVNAGDVLFVLGAGDADDLDAAQEQLRQLQISYQRAAINSPTFNYTGSERKLQNAYDEWQALLKAAEKAGELAQKDLSEKEREALKQAKKALADAQKQLEEIEAKVRVEQQEAIDAVEKAQQLVNKLLAQQEASGGASAPSTPSTPSTPASPEPSTKPETTPSPEPDTNQGTGSEQGDEAGRTEVENPLEISPGSADDASDTGANSVLDVKTMAASGTAGRVVALAAGGSVQATELEKAQKALEEAKAKLEEMNMGPDPRIVMAQTLVDTYQAEVDSYSKTPQMEEYNAALAAAKEAEELYYDLKDALDTQKISDGKSQALSGLDLADISAQIERQKKKIEELSGGDGNQVLANVSGTIESIECTAGDTVMEGGILCTIEVPDMGYTLSFSVTNEQARRLAPGDTATVSNYYWGSQIEATLATIRVDPKNPQTNKLLTFDLEGDVNAGSEITLSVGQRSAGYDTIVPNSAIRSDTNGQFVLIIESRNSPLGNRYIARRVDVEVLASDDVNSAVTGDLSSWSYVITTSNAPVNNGDMVRMADT